MYVNTIYLFNVGLHYHNIIQIGADAGTRTLNSDLEGHHVANYTTSAKFAAKIGLST